MTDRSHTEGWDHPEKSSVGKPLLPCPMCGDLAELHVGSDWLGGHHPHEVVSCGADCNVSAGLCFGDIEDEPAHVTWNTRGITSIIATLPTLSVDELDAIADALVAARSTR